MRDQIFASLADMPYCIAPARVLSYGTLAQGVISEHRVSMPQMNMVEAIRSALADAMAEDERVFVLGEDVAIKGGVFLASDGLLKQYGEQRVVDMPIAEAGIVGIAIGASLHGLRPVAEIQFADYIHPAIDQILNEAARFRYRSNGDWHCPIVVPAPSVAGVL